MPDVDEANRILIERLLRPIAEGRIDPIEGLNEFMCRFFWEYELPATDKVLGETIGVSQLVGLHYQLDDWRCSKPDFMSDPADESQLATLKAEIVRNAQAWLDQHPQLTAAQPSIQPEH